MLNQPPTLPLPRGARARARDGDGNQRPWPADKVERWPIDRLISYAKNARTHTDAQVAAIAASIKEWGWTTPALVGEDGGLIAGHARILAARQAVVAGGSEAASAAIARPSCDRGVKVDRPVFEIRDGNQRPWPADKVERWPIDRLIPYAKNDAWQPRCALMRVEQHVSVPRCGQLAVLTACRARGARFAVAQDARRDDPGPATIRNPGKVGLCPTFSSRTCEKTKMSSIG